MADAKKKEDLPNRKAIYVGRRVTLDGKVYHRFLLLPSRKEMHFGNVRGCWIGYTYKCWASQISKCPPRTDDEHIQDASWEAEDAVAGEAIQKKKDLARMERKSHWQIQRAVDEIRPLVKGVRHYEARALMDALLRKALAK